MRVKNFFFVTIFLAAASLGSALPKNSTKVEVPKNSTQVEVPKNSTQVEIPKSLANVPKNSTDVSQQPKVGSTANTDAVTQFQAVLDGSGAAPPSKECLAALLGVVTQPEIAKCLPISAFLPLLPVVTDPDLLKKLGTDPANTYKNELEKPLIQYATLFCPAPKCSDKAILDSVQTIGAQCATDLATNQFVQAIFAGLVFYSPLRDSSCFKDKDNFCFDESILTILSLPKSPFKITGNDLLDSIAVAEPNDVCTVCNKDIVDTFLNFLLDDKNPLNKIAFQILSKAGIDQKAVQEGVVAGAVKCGAKFVDSKIPK